MTLCFLHLNVLLQSLFLIMVAENGPLAILPLPTYGSLTHHQDSREESPRGVSPWPQSSDANSPVCLCLSKTTALETWQLEPWSPRKLGCSEDTIASCIFTVQCKENALSSRRWQVFVFTDELSSLPTVPSLHYTQPLYSSSLATASRF